MAGSEEPGAAPGSRDPLPLLFTDRFELRRVLGKGAMGVVHEAFDRERNSTVALKHLIRVSPRSILRFKNEFRSLADITHPNLVSLYELLCEKEQWFFTMELVNGVNFVRHVRSDALCGSEGETLSTAYGGPEAAGAAQQDPSTETTWIREEAGTSHQPISDEPTTRSLKVTFPARAYHPTKKLDYPRLLDALIQLATGLCALHERGFLHRDIKPSNVLVRPDGRVIVLDFSVVAELPGGSGRMDPAEIVGTPAYMPPEVADPERRASPAGDWYSVGIMLFEALTGWRPFQGHFEPVLRAKQIVSLPDPRDIVADAPADLAELCLELVRVEPAQRPGGQQVLERLQRVQHALGSRLSDQVPDLPIAREAELTFVGRLADLQRLQAAFASIQQGQGRVVRICGESGIGKSALTRMFVEQIASSRDTVVLAGRCHEWESVPYKAVDGLVDALVRHLLTRPLQEQAALVPADVAPLSRLFPVLRELRPVAEASARWQEVLDPLEVRRLATFALRKLVGRLAKKSRLVLLIDDLQWGDADSGPLLQDLIRPPAMPPLLLLLSFRSGDPDKSPLLRELLRPGSPVAHGDHVQELRLDPLSEAEARQMTRTLIDRLGQEIDPDLAGRVARESGGNPYFIHELVHFMAANPTSKELTGGTLTIEEAIQHRVQSLPRDARRLVEVTAVAGRPISQKLLRAAADVQEEVQQALVMLRARHLVRTTGARDRDLVEVYHDRIRESVVARLSAQELHQHHGQLVNAYASQDEPDLEALVLHLMGMGMQQKAAGYAVQAGDRATAALAFDRAVELYRLALAHGAFDRDQRRALLTRLGEALANRGQCLESARTYLEAIPLADETQTLDLHRRAAVQFLISGHVDQGRQSMNRALEAVGKVLPRPGIRALGALLAQRLRLRLRGARYQERDIGRIDPRELTRIDVCHCVAMGLYKSDTVSAWSFATLNYRLSLRAGDPFRIGRALAFEASYSAWGGEPARGRVERYLRDCEAIARQLDTPHMWGLFYLARGMSSYLLGDFVEAVHFSERAEEILRSRCIGVEWELTTAREAMLWGLQKLGQLVLLNRAYELGTRAAAARGDILFRFTLGSMAVFNGLLQRDRPEEARQQMEELLQSFRRQYSKVPDIPYINCMSNMVNIELYGGNGARAWDLHCRAWPDIHRMRLLYIRFLRGEQYDLQARAALAAARQGNQKELLAVVARNVRRLMRERSAWMAAEAELLRAGIAAFEEDTGQTLGLLERAERRFNALQMRHYAAAARRRRGQLLGGTAGQRLMDEADRHLLDLGICNPRRATRWLTPGFADALHEHR